VCGATRLQKHDVATLLYLYLKFSVYDDAIDLLVEVLDEKEERRREEAVEHQSGGGRGGKALTEWLPYTRLEQLEQQIQAVVSDAASPLSATERNRLVGAHKHLQSKLTRYLHHVEQRTLGLKQEQLSA
jgi:transcription elongation factor GreA-like protein